MEMQKHNPDYKLISVILQGKEFVYGETNTGSNPGLEIYYFNGEPAKGHHYSRRHDPAKIPGIYSMLYRRLKSLVQYCAAGEKLSLDNVEYHHIANLQGRYTNKDIIFKRL